jgi:hypothetical protein
MSFKGVQNTHSQTSRGLMAIAQPKKKEDKIKVEKKEKIIRKLVVEKEDKIFNVAKCRLVDNTLGNEFLG